MSRYIQLKILAEEQASLAQRECAKDLEQQMIDARRVKDETQAAELLKALNAIAIPYQGLFGDKEHLQVYLNWIPVKTASENVKYFKLYSSLEAVAADGVWAVDTDDWMWLKTNLEKVDLSQKDAQGNVVFGAAIRRKLAAAYLAVESATLTLDAVALQAV